MKNFCWPKIVVLFCLALVLISWPLAALAQEGRITSPQNGDQVEGVYEARGTIKDLPADNTLWLAVRKGKNFWPKDKALVVGGSSWAAQVDESGTRPGGSYSLVLLSVDQKGQAGILDWFRVHEVDQVWSAFVGEIPGATVLDMVDVTRK